MSRAMSEWMEAAMDAGFTVDEVGQDVIRFHDAHGIAFAIMSYSTTYESRMLEYIRRLRALPTNPEDWHRPGGAP